VRDSLNEDRSESARLVRVLIAIVATLVVSGVIVMRVLRRASAQAVELVAAAGVDGGRRDDPTAIAWCADGLEPVSGGGCLAVPMGADAGAGPWPLVVYLHGLYERDRPNEELDRQRRVAARATARGFAVLALRGAIGVCHPDVADFATRYCWPSNEQVAERARDFVDAWPAAIAAAQRHAGNGARYVLGFSSGGYFAALLAARSLFSADAFVIAHGGPVEPVRGRAGGAPILLLSADDDVAQGEMCRLDDDLTREQWPHDHRARDGAHGLTDGDIDVALAFFTRVSREGLPLSPPLPGHAPRWRERDASVGEAPAVAVAEPMAPDTPDARAEEREIADAGGGSQVDASGGEVDAGGETASSTTGATSTGTSAASDSDE
jgi:dienelactone hydrolase